MAGEFRLWMNLFLANFNPCRLTLMGSSNVETAVDSPSLNWYCVPVLWEFRVCASCSKSSSKMRLENDYRQGRPAPTITLGQRRQAPAKQVEEISP
jgi:hypothetical protein